MTNDSQENAPKDFSHLKPLQTAAQDKTLEISGNIGQCIFVMSGKGGVGKSSVTVNLAVALAERGFRVGILDSDLHGPSIPTLLGMHERLQSADGYTISPAGWGGNLKVVSIEAMLDNRDQAIVWRGSRKNTAIRQFISDVAWGDLDFLLIDSPPGTGDEHMAVWQSLPKALALVVTTAPEVALADVRKAFSFLRLVEAPILGLVENMSGFICPHCGEAIDLFSQGGGRKLAEEYQVPFLGAIPIDPLLVRASQEGKPIVCLEGQSPAAKAYFELADKVAAELRMNPGLAL